MSKDWGPNRPVTRAEFARAWDGVKEVAKHVDQLKLAFRVLQTRTEHIDRALAELIKRVDALDTTKVDA